MTNAQRGQICAVEESRTFTTAKYETISKPNFYLAHVIGVSRDGKIIKFRRLGDHYVFKFAPPKSFLISKGTINEEALISDMESRIKDQWDANDFDDLETLKNYVRNFK